MNLPVQHGFHLQDRRYFRHRGTRDSPCGEERFLALTACSLSCTLSLWSIGFASLMRGAYCRRNCPEGNGSFDDRVGSIERRLEPPDLSVLFNRQRRRRRRHRAIFGFPVFHSSLSGTLRLTELSKDDVVIAKPKPGSNLNVDTQKSIIEA